MSDPALFDPIIAEMASGIIKLDIGSGGPGFERRDPSWKTVDKFMPADIQADMGDLPFEDGRVDAIWSSHALEHVGMNDVLPILTEWYRVLKVGGTCKIYVPNFDYVAKLWLEKGMSVLQWVFGSQSHDGEYHKTAFDQPGLQEYMESVGFTVVKNEVLWTPEYSQESIFIEATK